MTQPTDERRAKKAARERVRRAAAKAAGTPLKGGKKSDGAARERARRAAAKAAGTPLKGGKKSGGQATTAERARRYRARKKGLFGPAC